MSTTTDQSSDSKKSIDYAPAYALQSNNMCLQNAQRSMLEGIIGILSKSSKDIDEWQKKWYQFCEDKRSNITPFEHIWDVFAASVSAIDVFIEQINDSIEQLKNAQKFIQKPKKQQSLKFKINQARSDVDKLKKQISELKAKETEIERKLDRLQINSSSNLLACIEFGTHPEDLIQRQENTRALIASNEKSLQKKERLFHTKAAKLYEESKNDELKRCRQLGKQSSDFVQSFNIKSEEFENLFKEYDPEEDLNQWEEEIFNRNAKQSNKSIRIKTK